MKANKDRVLYLHAGTHKTATTYIQKFFDANRQLLRERGLYVPESCHIEGYPGHHNLAFELNEDPRFDRRFGTVEDMIDELALRKHLLSLSVQKILNISA